MSCKWPSVTSGVVGMEESSPIFPFESSLPPTLWDSGGPVSCMGL